MEKIIECVPNFSEGRDTTVIKEITDTIKSIPGIKLLDVDSGITVNRTVVTFVGNPESVIEAAFIGIKRAARLIDMSKQFGEHPRFGATDVCPLIPVSNITMEETVAYARKLAERVGKELGIPVYCYENAAFFENRKSLANCRKGSYEGLKKRILTQEWKPDFGPCKWSEKAEMSGATAIGARDFLVACNINLDTNSVDVANKIASDVRESGRLQNIGEPVRIPGTLKKTRAIGWYIEEFGIAQVSMNLTDINLTPIHRAFEEVSKKAKQYNLRVTGSELIGLIPLQAMLEAGKYFSKKHNISSTASEKELIKVAIRSLGLDELKPFDPQKKIIEYASGKFYENH